jgi:hypothetical protein
MDLTVHIPDDDVPALKAKASGLSLETFAEQVLLERIHNQGAQAPEESVAANQTSPLKHFDNLSDLLQSSPFAGANLDLTRSKDHPRPVDLAG